MLLNININHNYNYTVEYYINIWFELNIIYKIKEFVNIILSIWIFSVKKENYCQKQAFVQLEVSMLSI